jgi:acyl-CoA thioesterase YciA
MLWDEESFSCPRRRPNCAGKLAIRTQAMPRDTNPSGDIFGGWMMA